MQTRSGEELKPSALDRFLRLATDVRAGESRTALLMFANVFLLLCAYYLIKPMREGWIAISAISGLDKMEVKAYSSFGQTLFLIPIVLAFARLSDRWSRATLITRSTLFCMSNMLFFWAIQPGLFFEGLPISGIVFYLWVGLFGVFVVAQFWTFAADVYAGERGERLLPLIAIGATAGAAAGSWATERLIGSGWVQIEWLLLLAMVPLTASIALTRMADQREPRDPTLEVTPSRAEPSDKRESLALVLSNRFLLATAIVTMLLSWVNTNGENLLFRVVQEALSSEASGLGITGAAELAHFTRSGTTVFYGDLYFWVNIIALALQTFVASRLLKYGGFGALLLTMPVVALVSYSAMALIPILAVVKAMKIAENATDYSINNTARHVVWLPTTARMKYQGKPSVDTFFVRAGDGLAALTVLVGVQWISLSIEGFFGVNIALIIIWLGVSTVVIREHAKLTAALKVDPSEHD